MRKILFNALILLTFLSPGLAAAEQTPPAPATADGLYFSGELAIGAASDTASEGIYEASVNYATGLSGGMGYRMGPVRLEGQLRWEFFDVSSITPATGSPMTGPENGVNFGGWGFMGNLYYDIGTAGNIRPYIGAGMGVVSMGVQEERYDYCYILCFESSPAISGSDTVKAWQAMAGLTIPAPWTGGEWYVGYRYYRTNEMEFNLVDYGPVQQDGLESHNVTFGIRQFLF